MSELFSTVASIDYPILDADAHVYEPPGVWQERVASRLRSLFWARPGSPEALERAAEEIVEHYEDRELLNSAKEESELTMCTDVDRNDKSRVCEPGSVRVIGRRLIEAYAGLFHTVDHVEGFLARSFRAAVAVVAVVRLGNWFTEFVLGALEESLTSFLRGSQLASGKFPPVRPKRRIAKRRSAMQGGAELAMEPHPSGHPLGETAQA